MTQSNLEIANQGFPTFRGDLNAALQALASNSSGDTAPTTSYPNQFWYETDTNILHIRNEGGSAWLDLMVIDGTTGSPSFNSGNVGIGTSTPSEKLDVVGAVSATNGFVDTGATAGGTNVILQGFRNDAGQSGGAIRIRSAGDGAGNAVQMFLDTNSTERLRIGDGTTGAGGGIITIANLAGTGSRAVNASSTGVLSAASDSRLKEEVPEALIPSLAEIMQLRPRAYKWLDDIEKRGGDAAVEIGFFADEVKDVIPSAAPMGSDGYYGFYDRSVVAALTKGMQEQQAIINSLEARLTALENLVG